MLKKFLTGILSVVIAAGAMMTPAWAEGETLSVGKFVEFGYHNGSRVLYEVIKSEDVSGDGTEDYLLLSRYAISYRPFDNAENGWTTSWLREWLNSSDQVVSYSGTTPSASGNEQESAYTKGGGFMYNMSAGEKEVIVSVTHGSVEDSVFVLSKDEYQALTTENKTPGRWTNADTAVGAAYGGLTGWTRTAEDNNKVCRAYSPNSADKTKIEYEATVLSAGTGIRPAMYINGKVTAASGSGTDTSPYVLNVAADEVVDTNIGKFVKLGRMTGSDIIWEIADKKDADGDGNMEYLLVSRTVIAYGLYDTEGVDWATATLRDWLNSDADTVTWTGTAPSAADAPYAANGGFLKGMVKSEKDLIADVTHDGACDKVFILSKDEFNALTNLSSKTPGVLNYSIPGYETLRSDFNGQTSWTRTPGEGTDANGTSKATMWRTAYENSSLAWKNNRTYDYPKTGIRPALWISANIVIPDGEGTTWNENAYKLVKTEVGNLSKTAEYIEAPYVNTTDNELDYALIVASYNGDLLTGCKIERGIPANTEGALKIALSEVADAEEAKAMLWNMETFAPVCAAVPLK